MKEIVREIIDICLPSGGWKPKVHSDGFDLIRNVGEGVEYIRFPMPKRMRGHVADDEVFGEKVFKEVEDILDPLKKDVGMGYINRTIHIQPVRPERVEEIILTDANVFQPLLPLFKAAIEKQIIPFFEEYTTIEAVHEKILALPKDKIGSFVYDPPVLKIATIKGLLKSDDFESYIDWAIDIYDKASKENQREIYVQSLAISKSLKTYFGY